MVECNFRKKGSELELKRKEELVCTMAQGPGGIMPCAEEACIHQQQLKLLKEILESSEVAKELFQAAKEVIEEQKKIMEKFDTDPGSYIG